MFPSLWCSSNLWIVDWGDGPKMRLIGPFRTSGNDLANKRLEQPHMYLHICMYIYIYAICIYICACASLCTCLVVCSSLVFYWPFCSILWQTWLLVYPNLNVHPAIASGLITLHILPISHIYIYICMYTYIHTTPYHTVPYITVHYVTLRYVTLRYVTLHCIIHVYMCVCVYIVYIYIYIICVYICIYVYFYICMYIYIHMYICIYVYR